MKAFRHLGECGSPGRAQSSKTDLEGRERDLLMKVFWFLVVGVWAAGTVWAFPPGHQPFLEDSRPDAYELQTIYAGKMLRIGDEPAREVTRGHRWEEPLGSETRLLTDPTKQHLYEYVMKEIGLSQKVERCDEY